MLVLCINITSTEKLKNVAFVSDFLLISTSEQKGITTIKANQV